MTCVKKYLLPKGKYSPHGVFIFWNYGQHFLVVLNWCVLYYITNIGEILEVQFTSINCLRTHSLPCKKIYETELCSANATYIILAFLDIPISVNFQMLLRSLAC